MDRRGCVLDIVTLAQSWNQQPQRRGGSCRAHSRILEVAGAAVGSQWLCPGH